MNVSIRRIVVPVDFSLSSERAARFAYSLGRSLQAHIYLVHVVDAGPSQTHLERYREARAAIEGVAKRIAKGGPITTEVRSGHVTDEITQAVIAYGADLVVMATHGRTGLPHLLMGSVAEEVIRTAVCPTLVMKDSGKVRVHQAHETFVADDLAQPA